MLWSALLTVWPTHRVSGRWVSDQYSMWVSTISFQLYSFWHHFEPGHTFSSPFLSNVYIYSLRCCAGYFSVFSFNGISKARVAYKATNLTLVFLSLTLVTSVLPAYCAAPSEAGALSNPTDLQGSGSYNPGSEKKCVSAIKKMWPSVSRKPLIFGWRLYGAIGAMHKTTFYTVVQHQCTSYTFVAALHKVTHLIPDLFL